MGIKESVASLRQILTISAEKQLGCCPKLKGNKIKNVVFSLDNVDELRKGNAQAWYYFCEDQLLKNITKCPKDHELGERTITRNHIDLEYQCDVCETKLPLNSTNKACTKGRCNFDICDTCRNGLMEQKKILAPFFQSLDTSCNDNG